MSLHWSSLALLSGGPQSVSAQEMAASAGMAAASVTGKYGGSTALPTRVSTLTLDISDGYKGYLLYHHPHLYALLGDYPGKVVKIDLDTFTRDGDVTFLSGEDGSEHWAKHGKYLYAACSTYPARVVCVDLEAMSRVGAVTLPSGEDGSGGIVYLGGYLYLCTYTDPIKVVSIDAESMTRIASVTLSTGEAYARAMCTDGEYLYIATNSSPAAIIKVEAATLTRVASVTLSGPEDTVYTIIPYGGKLYAICATGTGRVVRVDADTMTREDATVLWYGVIRRAILYDWPVGYLACSTIPAKVARFDFSAMSTMALYTMPTGDDDAVSVATDGKDIYVWLYASPPRVVRLVADPMSPMHTMLASGSAAAGSMSGAGDTIAAVVALADALAPSGAAGVAASAAVATGSAQAPDAPASLSATGAAATASSLMPDSGLSSGDSWSVSALTAAASAADGLAALGVLAQLAEASGGAPTPSLVQRFAAALAAADGSALAAVITLAAVASAGAASAGMPAADASVGWLRYAALLEASASVSSGSVVRAIIEALTTATAEAGSAAGSVRFDTPLSAALAAASASSPDAALRWVLTGAALSSLAGVPFATYANAFLAAVASVNTAMPTAGLVQTLAMAALVASSAAHDAASNGIAVASLQKRRAPGGARWMTGGFGSSRMGSSKSGSARFWRP